jgi:hypothetical protein
MKRHLPKLLFALLANAHLADAGNGVIVVGGTADGPRRTLVGDAVNASAARAGWTVAEPLPQQDTERLLTCKDPTLYACMPTTLAHSGVDRLFVVKVDNSTTDNGEPRISLNATVIGLDPRTLVADMKHCEHCADDELRTVMAALADNLISDLAQRSGRTVLDVKTDPAGARIRFDGKDIGYSNARFSIPPGNHQVTLEKPGYLTKTIEVAVPEGTSKPLDETLVSSKANAHRSRMPLALLITGLAGVAGGITLVVLDKDPGPSVGYRYLDSARWGYGLGGAGIVALGLSVYTWRTSKPPASTPTVSIVPGCGAVVGWSKSL